MKPAPILLDTCAALWLSTREIELTPDAVETIAEADEADVPVLISPITAWEVGQLVAKGRIALSQTPQQWFAVLLESGLVLADMSADTLIASSFLPASDLRDPADRILAATARLQGYRLMTRDRPLLAYGQAGHLQTIPC